METDYARLALSKIEDLEQRLAAEQKRPIGSARAYFMPRCIMNASAYSLAEVFCSGVITVLVRAAVIPEKDKGDTLIFSLNGINVAQASFEGNEKQCFGFGSALLQKGGIVSVRTEKGTKCILSACEVIIVGEGAEIRRKVSSCADAANGSLCAVVASDDDIKVKVTDLDNPDLKQLQFLCRGHTADVVSTLKGHRIVYCDNYGNMWGVGINAEGVENVRMPLGESVDALTVANVGDEIVVVTLKNKALWFFTCDTDFKSVTAAEKLGEDNVDAVKLVKGSEPLMLVIERDSVCYLRVAQNEENSKGEVVITIDETIF